MMGSGAGLSSSGDRGSQTDVSIVSTVPDRHGFHGGSQYTPDEKQMIPASVLLRRELKWISMLNNWERVMTKKYKKVRERCRKGIPPSVRPRAWQYLCGGKLLMDGHMLPTGTGMLLPEEGLVGRKGEVISAPANRITYANLIAQEGDPRWIDDIQKDLHRQFPFHEMFMTEKGHGQQDLFHVLKAYSVLNPHIGYCQAQAPLAAFLLMHMPAEHAFWCLVSLCDKYLDGYYSHNMETLQLDGEILFALLKRVAPNVYKHLKKQKIAPILYMTEWFLCVYTRTLPWTTILRIWDMFLCEGIKVVFKVALVLLRFGLGRSDILRKCPTMYETLEMLRNLPSHVMEEEFIVHQIQRLNLTDEDFQREHERQLIRRKAAQENGGKHKGR
ncbi:TBC1 domain family member whacked [Hetaerina americana]|uniref:TBC1 domain family member whacked n=1 Tax=Hetaerina americana TaxID=62018 RepID=UPI003A7F5219